MQRNVGIGDRSVRLFVACVLLFLIAMGFARSWTAFALGGVGAYLGLTAIAGYCPVLGLLSIDTDSVA